jgi:hypothetical protein
MMVETHQNKDKDKLLFYSKIVLKNIGLHKRINNIYYISSLMAKKRRENSFLNKKKRE